MTVRVFVQSEAGSNRKSYHDEKTLAYRHSEFIPHAYPLPYGFVIGTDAGDGGNVDCFVITNRMLKTGQIVECEPMALMEQFEDGVEDHNVLVRLVDETIAITNDIEAALTRHVLACFEGSLEHVSVGRFLGPGAALAHIATHLEPA